MPGRRGKPYAASTIGRLKCHACQRPARFQWNACADNNHWRPMCELCDVRVNVEVLKILYPQDWLPKIKAYCAKINVKFEEYFNEKGKLKRSAPGA